MLIGGIQLCLDLSRAFDQVSRALVEESVQSAGFSPEIESAILVWMHGGRYEIQHKGLSAEIPCSKGIKQGSKGGPYEWSLIARYVMMRLLQQKGLSWLQQRMVNFADDNHLSWQGSSEQQLYKAINEAQEALELLTDLGFKINFAKSVVMIRIVAFRKNHVVKCQDGMYLKCSTPRNT